ncbi:MAG: hypothetical protein LC750_09105 [Actinobacteria bacterium]|nr:hypothetical protein [Actinomycetota bacterium]
MGPDRQPNWQPISALATIGSLIDGEVDGGRDQYQRLLRTAERPYVLDDATVAWVLRVYGFNRRRSVAFASQAGR